MKTCYKCILFFAMFCVNMVYAQNIKDVSTETMGGVTYTTCLDIVKYESNKKDSWGAKVNGELVVPCKYCAVLVESGYLFAYPDYSSDYNYYHKPADIYTPDGRLLFSVNESVILAKKINEETTLFQTKDNTVYDQNKRRLYNTSSQFKLDPIYIPGTDVVLLLTQDYNLYNVFTGKQVGKGDDYTHLHLDYCFKKGNNGTIYFLNEKNGKWGVSNLLTGETIIPYIYGDYDIYLFDDDYIRFLKNGYYGIYDAVNKKTVLEPEFSYAGYLGGNLFKFKLNGYWGVINKDGKMIIPINRHYTKIEYSRTLKMFTFEKEGGYKGECDATGKQTNITKVSTPAPKPQPQKQKTTTQEPAPAPTPTPQTQPQPRQPQPVQEWVPCSACNGSGQCHICLGGGNSLQNPNSRCYLCSGTGKCTHCAGHGGHYETRYR